MSERYVYQVVSRSSPDGDWEFTFTKTPFYTKVSAARGAATQHRKRDEFHARQYARNGREYPVREYAVQRSTLGEWEVVPDVRL